MSSAASASFAPSRRGSVARPQAASTRRTDIDRGNALFTRASEAATDPKSTRLALSLVTDAIAIRPMQAKFYVLRSLLYRRLGDFALALYDQNAAVRLDRNNPASFCGRGLCLRKLGRPRDARSDFDTAIDLAEGHAEKYRFYRGLLLASTQQWAEAAEDFAAAAKAGVRYAYRATMNRIDCLWRGGLVSEALEALEAAQRHFPALPGAPSVASVLLLQLGRPQESVRQCWGEVMIFMMSQVASRHAQLVAAATALSRLQALAATLNPAVPPATAAAVAWISACGLRSPHDAAQWLRDQVRGQARVCAAARNR